MSKFENLFRQQDKFYALLTEPEHLKIKEAIGGMKADGVAMAEYRKYWDIMIVGEDKLKMIKEILNQ